MGDFRIPFVRETLKNGLRVQIVPLNHLHRVELLFAIRAGSRFESARENGLSHVVEHLLFRGNERRESAAELARAFDELGADLEPSTSVELVEYPISLPPERLEEGLLELYHLVATPLFRDLEIEKEILREELREDLDEDGRELNIDNLSRRALFGKGPLGQSIGGPISNLDRFTADDLRAHHARFYVGANASLTIAGRVDEAEALRLAREIFGGLPQGERASFESQAIASPKTRLSIVKNDDPQSELRIAFLAPGARDARYAVLALFLELLDGGMGGLLQRRIVDERGLAYFAFASFDAHPDQGVLEIGGTLSHAKLLEFIEASLELLEELGGPNAEALIDARTLASIKQRSRWAIESLVDEPGAIAQYLSEDLLNEIGRPLEQLLEEIEAVSASDLIQFARDCLGREKASITIVGEVSRAARAALKSAIHLV